jgi:hypothetical protein
VKKFQGIEGMGRKNKYIMLVEVKRGHFSARR